MAQCALILASGSPRRKELLGLFDIPFVVQPADIDESQKPAEIPTEYVQRLAYEKGIKVAQTSGMPVLSADTIVEFEEQILGKPEHRQDAERILKLLRGRTHRVYTAISLIDPSRDLRLERLVESDVLMRDYSETELQTYLDSGNWHDKAGAYAIQDPDFNPCAGYTGSYTNIMGLPIEALMPMLAEAGFTLSDNLQERIEDALGSNYTQFAKAVHENIA